MEETLRELYAALNRGDIPAVLKAFDPQVEWSEFLEDPAGGTYRGIADVQAHFESARAMWAEGTCEPERFVVAGDKVVALVHVRVRLKHETEWREGRLAEVYTFRDGKILRNRIFADRKQALDWAGVS